MNTAEHVFLEQKSFMEQKGAKVAKNSVARSSFSLPSILLRSFIRLVAAGAFVLGICASAVAQEEVDSQPLATPSIRIWDLAVAGGVFMIPIAAMSLLAVTMAIERLFALRRQRVLPEGLAKGLIELEQRQGPFAVNEALTLCQQYPSAAANVARAMLARTGRPLAEIESAVAQASQREADRLYANVRWINLAASLATMLGLIGTIQGMIMAFHRLTVTDVVADRTTMLAAGIYTALVTTFAGLAVAIPSLMASHFFEGRIVALFHRIDEMTFQLLPALSQTMSSVSGKNGDSALHGSKTREDVLSRSESRH
jgi:biopolymer transport protein ExbB